MEACKHAYIAISVLSLISKTAERVFLDRFSARSVILSKNAQLSLSFWIRYIFLVITVDRGEQTDVAFFDFSKAFDSVSHAHLISTLDQSGINAGNIITLVHKSSWLQRVVIYGESLDWLPVILGVSQGSLLGLPLFVLFINDMPSVLSHSSTLALLADDTKCFRAKIKSHTDCALLQDDSN